MKTLYILVLVLFAFAGFSQAPKKINYQGVARSNNGNPIVGTIGIKFDILQNQNTAIYTEVQTVVTNSLGVFSTQIGKNNPTLGTIAGINWTNGPYSLLVSIDTTGGTSYVGLPGQPIVSVPYAMYADSAAVPPLSYTNGLLHVGQKTVPISLTGAAPSLSLTGNQLSISGGNTLTLPTNITGSGATTVTPNANGYDINTPSVTLTGGTTILGTPMPPGLLQIFGTAPNYSLAVTPAIGYNNVTGVLTLSNQPFTSPTYSYAFNVAPNLSLQANVLTVGPNSVDFNPIAPWRWNQNANMVYLAAAPTNTQAVGINTVTPICALDINGYTKLGATAPLIQTIKMTTVTVGPNLQTFMNLPMPQNKIISVTMMVDASSGLATFDWIPPLYVPQSGPTGFQYNWRISQGKIFIENLPGSSSQIIAGRAVNIYITYEQ